MTIFDQLVAFCEAAAPKRIFSLTELKLGLGERFHTNPGSVIPSDHCYNRWNRGLPNWCPLFVRLGAAEYEYVGRDHGYTGLVLARPKGCNGEQVMGEWVDGQLSVYPAPAPAVCVVEEGGGSEAELGGLPAQSCSSLDGTPSVPAALRRADGDLPLSSEQVERLFAEYMRVLDLEVGVFGCKPTETRHLIGRLGEFYCARLTGGRLATRVNQSGFDVVGPGGRRISVKTTAQRSGFVAISAKTLDRADDLMVIHYDAGEFRLLYHGDIRPAVEVSRRAGDYFELDLNKARALSRPTRDSTSLT